MIKVTIGESKTQEEKPFPKLMINKSSGNIWLVQRIEMGFCILPSNNHYELGEESSDLSMENLTDYNEPITLQNQ